MAKRKCKNINIDPLISDLEPKIKELKEEKREIQKQDFKTSKERKAVMQSFKKEARAIKRSDKNKLKNALKTKFGV